MSFPPTSDDARIPGQAPVSSHSALSFVLSGVMLVIYLGFILLVAYDKPLLGQQIVPGLSWGILLGALVIVSAWVLTFIYVAASNKKGGNL